MIKQYNLKIIFFSLLSFIFLVATVKNSNAQSQNIDSLNSIISQHKGDTNEVNALAFIANRQENIDSSTVHALQALQLARNLKYKKGEADCLSILCGVTSDHLENSGKAIVYALDAIKIYDEIKDNVGLASILLLLQDIYWQIGDYKKALSYAFTGLKISETYNIRGRIIWPGHCLAPLFLSEMGQTYVLMNQLDSALYYTQKCLNEKELFNGAEFEFAIYLLATIENMQGNYQSALKNYREAIPLAIREDFLRDTLQIYAGMSTLFKKMQQPDSAIHYAKIVAKSWSHESETKNLLEALNNLAAAYKMKGNKDSAIKYMELGYQLNDSIFNVDKDREVQNITFNEQLKQQEIIADQLKYKSKVQLYAFLAGLFIMILIAAILWRNNIQKQKAKAKIETALQELKATQKQLIQSEKMASLGELTAGIAHEIQNPLNFINNFSEVNKELIEELKQERSKAQGTRNEKMENEILNDIEQNSEKINHHGKKADAIVKAMLQHSHSSIGEKESTNINGLAEEYLRVAYHGFRAKDKTFNATLNTGFDDSIGKINIISRDIGRVLFNLYNNAFYAVGEKKKQQPNSYEPVISISTKKNNNKIEIRVKDNGNGIPQKIVDKIFQPFFTTKPTGQGTGLGLSLSYDIIKAHGGELKAETKEGQYAEFIIELPSS